MKCFTGDGLLESRNEEIQVPHIVEPVCHAEQEKPLVGGKGGNHPVKVMGVCINVQSAKFVHGSCKVSFFFRAMNFFEKLVSIRKKKDIVNKCDSGECCIIGNLPQGECHSCSVFCITNSGSALNVGEVFLNQSKGASHFLPFIPAQAVSQEGWTGAY